MVKERNIGEEPLEGGVISDDWEPKIHRAWKPSGFSIFGVINTDQLVAGESSTQAFNSII